MARRETREEGGRRKRKLFRWLVIGGGLAGLAYAVAKRQKPGPSIPAAPEDRVRVVDEESIGGLGSLMSTLLKQLVQNPQKCGELDGLNLTLAIEPKSQPEMAITMTFSDGRVVIEPGVVHNPDITIICELDVLMQMSSMGYGLKALKYMTSPEGKKLAEKFTSGELKIKGLAAHPLRMMKFSKFLSIPEDGSG